MLQSF